jgi:subtilisin family serine protease
MKLNRLTFGAVIIALSLSLLGARPAAAQQRLIVRTLNLPLLKDACLLNLCKVTQTLDGAIGQLFLVELPDLLPIEPVVRLLNIVPGVLDVEIDTLRQMPGGLPLENSAPAQLFQRTPVNYYGNTVWMGYVQQPAAQVINNNEAHAAFNVAGKNVIVADIDTGVDFTTPALQGVLMQGYDFTRNRVGGDEMADVSGTPAASCSQACQQAQVNQSTAAVLDQSTAAVLDQSTAAVLDSPQYSDFGHGTMVMGVIHLVAPQAWLMPLKSFSSNGTGYTSNIIAALYFAVQNKAGVVNMSFDFTSPDNEVSTAISYAEKNGVVLVASAGNNGAAEVVYPAGLGGVMGVGSVNDVDQRSTFSNYGSQVVWVAAPGENIMSTFPYDTYATSSGTSFSSPMVAGGAALALSINGSATPQEVSSAIAHAVPVGQQLNHGVLNLMSALSYMQAISNIQ